MLMALLAVLLAAGLGALLSWLLKLATTYSMPWWADLRPTRLMMGGAVLLALFLAAWLLGRRSGLWGALTGVWMWWALLSVALVFTLPGAGILFVVPVSLLAVLLACLMLMPALRLNPSGMFFLAALLPMLIGLALFFPISLFIEIAMGYDLAFALTAFAALGCTGLLALAAFYPSGRMRLALPLASLAVILAGFAWAVTAPVYTPAAPQPVSITYLEDRSAGKAYFAIRTPDDRVPPEMTQALPLQTRSIYPWTDYQRPVVDAPMSQVEAPSVEVVSDTVDQGRRTLTLRLRSPRKAAEIDLYAPLEHLSEVIFDGRAVPFEKNLEWSQTYMLACYGQECDGQEVVLTYDNSAPITVLLADLSFGLPQSAQAVIDARPFYAAPVDFGDIWLVSQKMAVP
jgi:hypothetical protein